MRLTSGSLFTGIGGFDLGLEYAGITCKWQVEIDKHCQGVLAKHWPGVAKYGDIHDVGKHNLETVDIITGGFPCQDLSVAGRRRGLARERSGLFFEYARVIREIRPPWIIVENVPGLFSSNKGEDFVIVLETLAECGYGVVWRVLDSQYFGVAQRRRRVFIVGYSGNGRGLAGAASRADERGLERIYPKVLFESESLSWDIAPRREAGKEIARILTGGAAGGNSHGKRSGSDRMTHVVNALTHDGVGTCGADDNQAQAGHLIAGHCTGRGWWNQSEIAGTLRAEGENRPSRPSNVICYAFSQESDGSTARNASDLARPITNRHGDPGIRDAAYGNFGVRRLTPTECERLQGFPDSWTAGQSDSARYRQLGNAVTVPVVEWIGGRIASVERVARKAPPMVSI
jgi:DNA (cytosine-5)-methyltransferase 1